jgi:hypothetical protein
MHESLKNYDPILNHKLFYQLQLPSQSLQKKYDGIMARMEAFPQKLTDEDFQEFAVIGLSVCCEKGVITEEQREKYAKIAREDLELGKDIYVALMAY